MHQRKRKAMSTAQQTTIPLVKGNAASTAGKVPAKKLPPLDTAQKVAIGIGVAVFVGIVLIVLAVTGVLDSPPPALNTPSVTPPQDVPASVSLWD
jgi:hypothetical protein